MQMAGSVSQGLKETGYTEGQNVCRYRGRMVIVGRTAASIVGDVILQQASRTVVMAATSAIQSCS